MKEKKKPHQTAPPPAKPVAGDPDPLRRPTDPPATCPWEGSNPTPETWGRPPQTSPCLEGPPAHRGPRVPLREPVGQSPVGLARLGEDAGRSVLQHSPPRSTPVTVGPCRTDGGASVTATPLTPDTPADWLNGRQEGAPVAATPQGAINRCPLNTAVKPHGGEHL